MNLNNLLIVIQRSFLILFQKWMSVILKLLLQRMPSMIRIILSSLLLRLLLLFSNLSWHLELPCHQQHLSYLYFLVRLKINILISIRHWSSPWISLVPKWMFFLNWIRCTSYSYRRQSFCMILLHLKSMIFHIQFSSCSINWEFEVGFSSCPLIWMLQFCITMEGGTLLHIKEKRLIFSFFYCDLKDI